MPEIWDNIEVQSSITDEEIIKEMGIDPDAEAKPSDPMRSAAVIKRFRQVLGWWMTTKEVQMDARNRRMKDHNVYEGEQWAQKDKDALAGRGQKALTINRVKPAVDWVLGTEKRTRIDSKVLPRTEDDIKGAETKTKIMKYSSDVNMAPFHRSRAFSDTAISGLGWIELGIRGDPEEEPVYYRYEDWRNMWYDPLSVETDLSDAKFVFRTKIVDLDIAAAMFPEQAGALRAAADKGGTYYNYGVTEDESELTIEGEEWNDADSQGAYTSQRSRVRLVECWYTRPEKKKLIAGEGLGTLAGTRYDESNESMKALVEGGYATTYDALQKVIRCMMFAEGMTYPLQDAESPYNHNRYPFVPMWAYRRKKGNEPYGTVRNVIDMQDDLNKRHSKALYILATNRVTVDDDATKDWDRFYTEVNRPDGVVKVKKGSKVDYDNDRDLAAAHISLMTLDAKMIQDISGVTDENMGRQTNATSGRAIERRQDQGHVVTAEIFDNLRMAVQLAGEMELSLIEQFKTEEEIKRVTGDRGEMEFVHINRKQPDKDGNLNDITARKADFVVDSQAYNATIRQAMFESMLEVVGKLPEELAVNMLDVVIDMSDVPQKDELVKRIRAFNGQEDPNADPDDPEVQQQKQAQAEAEAKQQQIMDMMQKLQVQLAAAKVDKTQAEAEKTDAQVEQVEAETRKTDAEVGGAREKTVIEKAKVLNEIEKGERADRKVK